MSTQGNTLGTTGTNAAGIVLVGGTNITLSQSSGAGGATISFLGQSGTLPPIATAVKAVAGAASVGTITRYSPEDHVHPGVGGLVASNTASTFIGNVVLSGTNLTLVTGGNSSAGSLGFSVAAPGTSPPIATQVYAVSNVGSTGTVTRFAPEDHVHPGVAGINASGTASTFIGNVMISGTNLTLVTGGNSTAGSIGLSVAAQSAITLLEWPPEGNLHLNVASQTLYSGSTSANGASTFSTLSYYVQPYEIQNPVKASRIDLHAYSIATAAGTGSISDYHYMGLYKLSPASDSLTLVSSWFGAFLYSANSVTQITLSLVTGSASNSIVSFAGNSTAQISGVGARPIAIQMGASSLIQPDAYWVVNARHSITAGVNVVQQTLGGYQNNSADFGFATTQAYASIPLNGAFSSTSSTNVANSNQWLMPPSVATNLIQATTTAQINQLYVKFRGI